MEATRAEKNRVIAEWLNMLCQCEKDEFGYSRHGYGTATGRCYKCNGLPADLTPDFFTSEEASALARRTIREKMPYMVFHREDGMEVVRFVPKDFSVPILTARGATEMEATAEAAYLCAVERKATV